MLRLHAKCLKHWRILKETTKPAGPFETMPQEPWHSRKDAKLDHVIQVNCREVHTHANYKATKTWENFNNWGVKMILFSDELWSITNDSNKLIFVSDRK